MAYCWLCIDVLLGDNKELNWVVAGRGKELKGWKNITNPIGYKMACVLSL